MGLFKKIGSLFKSPKQDPAIGTTNDAMARLQQQLSELSAQTSQLNPDAPYTPTEGENQYLGDLANRVSARYASLGFGESPLTGGEIARTIAPELSNFRNQAFQNKLAAFGERSNILGNYYSQLLNRQQILQANKKQPWWKQLISPALTAAGTAFGGPVGGAVGKSIGDSIYTPPPSPQQFKGGFAVSPFAVNYPK